MVQVATTMVSTMHMFTKNKTVPQSQSKNRSDKSNNFFKNKTCLEYYYYHLCYMVALRNII